MVIVKHAKLLTMICRWCSRRLTYSLVRRSVLSYWSLCIVALVSAKMPGYVGPSCAVVVSLFKVYTYIICKLYVGYVKCSYNVIFIYVGYTIFNF